MRKKPLLISIIFSGAVVFSLHTLAVINSLYWVYDWFDIMMHFLGGAFVTLVGLFLYEKFQKKSFFTSSSPVILLNLIIFVFIAGLLWETSELLIGATYSEREMYASDTKLDFIMNTIGAIIGYFYAKRILI
jgi:hypothetical protein